MFKLVMQEIVFFSLTIGFSGYKVVQILLSWINLDLTFKYQNRFLSFTENANNQAASWNQFDFINLVFIHPI